jgi:uncharacterized protein (DUF2336 family)
VVGYYRCKLIGEKLNMNVSMAKLVDISSLEKIVLAKKVGTFLVAAQADIERREVENVARVLAQDVSCQVREVLAFELRRCRHLPQDISKKIVKDIESVSGPFIEGTLAFSDEELLEMIPDIDDNVRVWMARRGDLTPEIANEIARVGAQPSVMSLVRNDRISLEEMACGIVITRFGDDTLMMDQIGVRRDLPSAIVEQLIDKVSEHCRTVMVETYQVGDAAAQTVSDNTKYEMLWRQVDKMSDSQIHTFVAELRENRRLNHQTTVEIASRGSRPFMESALALEAGLPKGRVKEILTMADPAAFVRLMKMANVPQQIAALYLRLSKGQTIH